MIEEGEYIRTYTGKVAKANIINNVRYTHWSARARGKIELAGTKRILINGKYELEDILKHSKNIIDLIEVGDYVNGYKITNKIELLHNKVRLESGIYAIDGEIKTILTKEQMEANCYTVEEE